MRAGSRPQYRRFRRIVEMLKAGMRSGRLPAMADFQRELEASRRTITRDLDFLRLEENAPIAYDPVGRGYRLTDKSFALPPVELSQGDLANLAAARAVLGGTSSSPAGRAMDGVLGKIAETAPAGYSRGHQTCACSDPGPFATGSSAICNPTVETVPEPVNFLTEESSQTCPWWSEHGIRPSAA